jgi:hypothetical protein
MDLINISFARDASGRALLGARLDDPVVPDSPGRLTRARRGLAHTLMRVRPRAAGTDEFSIRRRSTTP